MNILGISCFYHDSAACLVQNDKIVAAAQEERFTRKKHDQEFPENAVKFCLNYANLTVKDLDYVAFYDKPFLKFERILETYLTYAPRGFRSYLIAVPLWLRRKLWIPDLIQNELGYKGKLIYPEHHESHAASAFFPSPFQEAAFITMDGVGEWTTTSYGIGKDNNVLIQAELQFPHSLGLLYSAFTYYTGFKVNSGEYKVMGLAPYGEPKYVQTILDNLIDIKEDGSFKLNMAYFNYCAGLTMTNGRFDKLFDGPPRKPESKLTQREMDLARSIQVVTEEVMLKTARHVHKETGQKYLCLAGGVALNCVGNGRILREVPFEDIWIQPAAGDAGGALGAALLAYYQYLGNERTVTGKEDLQQGSYLGPEFSDSEIQKILDEHKAVYTQMDYDDIPEKVSELIADQKVVGWFQGRMEFGPRALGSRSIIGDARSAKMQEVMNLKIKFRESFRPFAPSILAERVSTHFEIDRESPYMLLVAPVKEDKRKPVTNEEKQLFGTDKLKFVRSDIPAVTHVDYSARIQTVNKKTNPLYYEMISAVEAKTGCPVIINTSFNVRGEPIVCTPMDAYKCFMRTNMDFLIMGKFLLDKELQPEFHDEVDWQEEFELD
ncbi:carbamoyltransferase [candidate division KSB1 bacterium]|nr:carbamoyltransferase [candidate division KSB1 bacterium]NIR72196.1 carbamoyltransferase [candidate division KSB1 bacterium]NIS26661.1 carbamoyltransferase [candidate division KSB1 bacterium]NIT73429.1 carbamoyltransferase [candidate division KSB1 bacterium]NIU27277.1 carbamoyltransferase [candidate division KSB1 bacterium]